MSKLESHCSSVIDKYNEQATHKLTEMKNKIKEMKSVEENIKLLIKNANITSTIECNICFSEKNNYALFCGHLMCKQCTDRLDDKGFIKCPFCKQTVQYMKIFI